MILYITNNENYPQNTIYRRISLQSALDSLFTLDTIGIDTETSGLDVHKSKLLLIQLGNEVNQYVFDMSTINIQDLKPLLESNKEFIFHNAKFDLKYFLKEHIIFKRIYDTFLAEKILWLGYPSLPKNYQGENADEFHTYSLKDCVWRYCKEYLDKTQRGQFIIDNSITPEKIIYAAKDVEFLEQIQTKQLDQANQNNLIKAIKIENNFVQFLAYTELCGVKLDINKWQQKIDTTTKQLNDTINKLNQWLINADFPNKNKYVIIDNQGDLFAGFNLDPQVIINWDSSTQVIQLLKNFNINIVTNDKKTGLEKESIEAKLLQKYSDKCDLIPIYLQYKELAKLNSTYGDKVIKQVNPNTGRIYTQFNQLGAISSRLSCGGKDKENNLDFLNFQNFPNDELTRSCFIAEDINDWISVDFSGQESRIIACLSKDPAMLELFKNGCGDVHSLTAKMSYPEVIKDTPIEEIKSKFHNYRQEAKGIEFSINYGGNSSTISNNKGIPIEEATTIYNNYMKGFKGIKEYQDKQREFIKNHEYILLNNVVPYKSYIPNYNRLKDLRTKFDGQYWIEYKSIKSKYQNGDYLTDFEKEKLEEVKYYFKTISNLEKHAINFPCQGSGAIMFKIAGVLFWNYLKENNLLFKVLTTVLVHDEINCEAPKDISKEVASNLQQCMAKAGHFLFEDLEFPADAEIGKCWIH